MFCTECGAQMHEKAKFCPKCGHPVTAEERSAAAPEEINRDEIPSAPLKTGNPVRSGEEDDLFPETMVMTESEPIPEPEDSYPKTQTVAELKFPIEKDYEESVPAAPIAPASLPKPEDYKPVPPEPVPMREADSLPHGAPPVTEIPSEVHPAESEKQPEDDSLVLKEKPGTDPHDGNETHLKRKKIIALIVYILLVIAVLILCGYVLPFRIMPELMSDTSSEMKNSGMDFHAAALNDSLGYRDEADELRIAAGKKALEDEDYPLAMAIFSEYKDNSEYEGVTDLFDEACAGRCRWLVDRGMYTLAAADTSLISDLELRNAIGNDIVMSNAVKLSSEGKHEEAYKALADVRTTSPYDTESYNIILFNYAAEFYNNSNFEDAYNVLKNAGSAETIDLRNASSYHCAEEYFRNREYDKALEMYGNADGYADSADKIRQCHYQNGVIAFNQGSYADARGSFEKADGYKDSASYINKIDKIESEKFPWTVTGEITDYISPITGNYSVKTRLSSKGDFILVYTVHNENPNAKPLNAEVTIRDSNGVTSTHTCDNLRDGDTDIASFCYDDDDGIIGSSATFTVKNADTDQILGTFRFTIY